MHPKTKKRIESFLAIVGLVSLFTIVFTPGLCWLFFDKQLGHFLTFLDGHSKVIASLLKITVLISGLTWLATPIVIMCCIYTATKEHRYNGGPAINFRFKPGFPNMKGLSLKITNNDIESFIENELEKLQNDLAERRDAYLSVYNSGPLFLTETRERLKNKMSVLLDYQDEVILSMYTELQLEIIDKIRHQQQLTNDGLQNGKIAAGRSKYYPNDLEDFYTEIHTAFTKKIERLNSKLQALSDDHLNTLENLSKAFSDY